MTRAPRRDPCCADSDSNQEQRRRYERDRIARANLEQHRGEHASYPERQRSADDHPRDREDDCLANHLDKEITPTPGSQK